MAGKIIKFVKCRPEDMSFNNLRDEKEAHIKYFCYNIPQYDDCLREKYLWDWVTG